jgi:hypothetical protein
MLKVRAVSVKKGKATVIFTFATASLHQNLLHRTYICVFFFAPFCNDYKESSFKDSGGKRSILTGVTHKVN